jgi:hypothetical protein
MPRKIIRRAPSVTEAPLPEPVEMPTPAPDKAKHPKFLVPLLIIILLAGAGYAGVKYLPLSSKGATQASAASAPSVDDVIKQVAKHVLVNLNENPMVATVQDPDKLRAQNPVFYKDAQQGDRLLIWSDKAVLYSPSRDVVLAMLSVGAFNAGNASGTTSAPAQAQSPSKDGIMVEVRNGSTTPGLARKVADLLKADGWKIVTIADAKVKPVATTSVLASSKKFLGSLPASLAAALHGQMVSSLGGEPTSSADILVIVGNNFQP